MDRQTAKAVAAKAAAQMGKGWRPRLFQNMGWYWYLRHKSGAELRQFSSRSWWATVFIGGRQKEGEGRTAKSTMANLLKKVQVEKTGLEEFLKEWDK